MRLVTDDWHTSYRENANGELAREPTAPVWGELEVPPASAKPAPIPGAPDPDRLGQLSEQISAACAQLDELQRGIVARAAELTEREAKLLEQETQLRLQMQAFEQDQAAVAADKQATAQARSEIESRQAELAARSEELEKARLACEADRAALDQQRQSLENERSEFEQRAAGVKEEMAAIDAARAELAAQRAELEKQQKESAELLARLDAQKSEQEERQKRLDEDANALQALQTEFEATQTEVTQERERQKAQAEHFVNLELDYQRREEAIQRFQQVFSQMASAFSVPGPLQELHATVSEFSAGHEPLTAPSFEPSTPTSPPVADSHAEAPAAGSHAEAPRAAKEAAPEMAKTPAADPPAAKPHGEVSPVAGTKPSRAEQPDSVDTVDFSAEEIEKLRVLRRLVGGNLTDGQLVARIRAERKQASARPPMEKPGAKKRWWG